MAAVESRGGDGAVERIPVSMKRPLSEQGPSPAHQHHCTAANVTSSPLGESGVVGHDSNTNGIASPTRTTATYAPARVRVESSTRHQLQHSPQEGKRMPARGRSMTASFVTRAASIDTSDQNIPPTTAQSFKRTPSYMQPTQSSLRCASEDNTNKNLASAHHFRIRDSSPNGAMSDNVDDDDGGGNVSSSASSHRSSQRVHVRTRTLKRAPVIKSVVQRGASPPTLTKATSDSPDSPNMRRAQRSTTVASPASLASRGDLNRTVTSDIGRTRCSHAAPPSTSIQCSGVVHENAVVSQTGSLSSGAGGNQGRSPDHRGGGGSSSGTSIDEDVADSASLISSQSLSLTIVTVSDDNITELLGAISLSQDIGASDSHTQHKSLQAEQRWWNYSKPRSGAAFANKGGCNGGKALSVASEVRRRVEHAPYGTQSKSFPVQSCPSSLGITPNVLTRGHGGLQPRAHRGDASPNAAQKRQRNGVTASNTVLLSTKVPRRTGAQMGDRVLQPEQGRRPPPETALRTQSLQLRDEGTKTPPVRCARSFDSESSTGSPSGGANTIDNTSMGAVKERADDDDVNRNAAASAMQPCVPRLALERIHAHRERQRAPAGASYKVARHMVGVSGRDSTTSSSSSSGALDVTVSSLTNSAWPSSHSGGAGHSCTSKESPIVDVLGLMDHQDHLNGAVVVDHQHASSLSAGAPNQHFTVAQGVSTYPSHTSMLMSGSASDNKGGGVCGSDQTSTDVRGHKATCLQVTSPHTAPSRDSPTAASPSKAIQGVHRKTEGAMRAEGITGVNQGVRDIDVDLAHSQQVPEAADLQRRPADMRHNTKCCLVM